MVDAKINPWCSLEGCSQPSLWPFGRLPGTAGPGRGGRAAAPSERALGPHPAARQVRAWLLGRKLLLLQLTCSGSPPAAQRFPPPPIRSLPLLLWLPCWDHRGQMGSLTVSLGEGCPRFFLPSATRKRTWAAASRTGLSTRDTLRTCSGSHVPGSAPCRPRGPWEAGSERAVCRTLVQESPWGDHEY